MITIPRLTIAGISGDSGKTFFTCGLLAALREKGLKSAPFKKGPDYIDPAWLRNAAGSRSVANLDTYIMGEDNVLRSFFENSKNSDIAVIEGNRGLYDGVDEQGSYSTAALAKLLGSPVLLVLNTTKATRTTSAIALGCKMLDQGVNIAGIVLNQIGSVRHADVARRSIESDTGIPVVAALPRIKDKVLLPSRHLGLITPYELSFGKASLDEIRQLVLDYSDIDKLIEIAKSASEVQIPQPPLLKGEKAVDEISQPPLQNGEKEEYLLKGEKDAVVQKRESRVRIGYIWDKAFSFYYDDNLRDLRQAGAELVPISTFTDKKLPEIDGLYIGGGFPEVYPSEISENRSLLNDIKEFSLAGKPVYAECGGMMLIARCINISGESYEMAGVLPFGVEMKRIMQGHGYFEGTLDGANPFFDIGTRIRGHEFHYSKIIDGEIPSETCINVEKGTGFGSGRDGFAVRNTFAAYLHLHALGAPHWAKRFVELAYAALIQ